MTKLMLGQVARKLWVLMLSPESTKMQNIRTFRGDVSFLTYQGVDDEQENDVSERVEVVILERFSDLIAQIAEAGEGTQRNDDVTCRVNVRH